MQEYAQIKAVCVCVGGGGAHAYVRNIYTNEYNLSEYKINKKKYIKTKSVYVCIYI